MAPALLHEAGMTYKNLSLIGMGLATVLVAAGCAGKGASNRGVEIVDAAPAPAPAPAPQAAPVEQPPPVVQPAPAPQLATFGPVYFDFDSAQLRADSLDVLAQLARALDRDRAVLVAGHTDERGTAQYNIALGARRAEAVKDYLIRLGVAPSQVRTVSFGKEQPAVEGSNEAAWEKNRRAEFDAETARDSRG
jgi:peptidoglycan-associated lipoprotein